MTRQCALLGLPRSAAYRKPVSLKKADLELVRLLDMLHLDRSFYGSRKIAYVLSRSGYKVGRKRVVLGALGSDSWGCFQAVGGVIR